MAITLSKIVPWGRSYEEYAAMFDLSTVDLQRRILGCADGPAAFNAELSRRGGQIISVDPLYGFSANAIRRRISATYDDILTQVRQSQDDYVWTAIASVEELGQIRLQAMESFLADYETGKRAGRYVEASLPQLPFTDHQFELALVSHFLFLYSEHLSADFHMSSLRSLLRIASEIRIFPLLTLECTRSPYVNLVVDQLMRAGHTVTLETVRYEFQRGGNEMMVVRR